MRAKTLVTTVGAVFASTTLGGLASSVDLTRRAIVARRPSGAALGLYPAWCAFATLLSTRIWQLNRDD
jgi:tryptophan-rich sensory protein